MSTEIEPVVPERTALLILDYQNGILASLPGSERLLALGAEAISQVRDAGGTIGYVRVAFADGEQPGGMMGKRVGDAATTTYHADAETTQIHHTVAPQAGDIVVRKTRVGPFGSTDLHEQLQARDIDTLLIGGVATSGATLSTVRDAHDRDYRLVVISDLCADRSVEVHDFLVEHVLSHQADVITTAELADLLP